MSCAHVTIAIYLLNYLWVKIQEELERTPKEAGEYKKK